MTFRLLLMFLMFCGTSGCESYACPEEDKIETFEVSSATWVNPTLLHNSMPSTDHVVTVDRDAETVSISFTLEDGRAVVVTGALKDSTLIEHDG